MRENVIEEYLKDEVQKRGGHIFKLTFIGINGAPDRLAWIPQWSTGAFIELKRPGKDLESHQRRRHGELQRMGFNTYMVNSKDAVDKLMRLLW